MSDKLWRITDEETFCDRSIEYMIPMIVNFMSNKKFTLPKDKQNKIDHIMKNITEDRVKGSIKSKLAVIGELLNILIEDVDEWASFSLNPDIELDDIMLRAIISTIYGKSFLCYTYISSNNNLTYDFIHDLNYVTSGLFKFNEFDDDHVNTVNKYFEIEDLDVTKDKDFKRLYKFTKNGELVKNRYNELITNSKKTALFMPRLDYKRLSGRFPELKNKYPVIYNQYIYSNSIDDPESEQESNQTYYK